MSNTFDSDSPSEEANLSYYTIGLSFGFLFIIMFIAVTSYYCTHRNFQNRLSTRPSGSSNSSNRTVIIERDISAITIQVQSEEEKEAIYNSYPQMLYSQAKLHKPEHCSTTLSCIICLADYNDSEWLRFLPDCGHYFHKECIDMWLKLNMSCPVCRNSPFPTPLPTPIAEVTPLATRRD
ncbi:unnamed protein product [Lupinus luteus]|uniref:RING-type domain-containing protein n=1 Tax=Lupinus luteus TaxID=3873 RepID=A0AAV1VS24_LUPLU